MLGIVALAGCGGDDGDDEAAPAGQRGETIAVSLVDFRLEPGTIRIPTAGTYTFRATNDGQTQHALEIEGGGIEEETEVLDPGQSGEVTVELKAGDYEIYCPVGDHKERGMEGDLIVGSGTTTDDSETDTGDGY